jgi:hypothetical protein
MRDIAKSSDNYSAFDDEVELLSSADDASCDGREDETKNDEEAASKTGLGIRKPVGCDNLIYQGSCGDEETNVNPEGDYNQVTLQRSNQYA